MKRTDLMLQISIYPGTYHLFDYTNTIVFAGYFDDAKSGNCIVGQPLFNALVFDRGVEYARVFRHCC